MFDPNTSLFQSLNKIPNDAQVVFVSDMFVEQYVGGAELTSEALITSSPFKVAKLKSSEVTPDVIKQGSHCHWIFGNFSNMNMSLIPLIVQNLQYSVVEYDYKFCRYRSPEKHRFEANVDCDCAEQMHGKIVSAFYHGAKSLWWMSEKQKDSYVSKFPFLSEKDNIVLSSVFDKATLGKIKLLREANKDTSRNGWIVLGSNSWIKGKDAAEQWCKENAVDYEVVWNLKYDELLTKLAHSYGHVYMPPGGDTCPRLVIEAKLLGCKLELNDNVQHKDEEWFVTDNIEEIESYLYAAPALFWNGIKKVIDYKPTISGYSTTYDCMRQQYPFEQSISSLLQFCDEVCVVDGGSTDGTWEKLNELAHADTRIKLKQVERDWKSPRFAVFDGMQKAEARSMCTSEFCWQQDVDEVVHEDDAQKIRDMAAKVPAGVKIISLPVVEFWGSVNKVRIDVNPWKWRLSRNDPTITHGIPKELRKLDADGNLYSAPGSDGCDMVFKDTWERVPHVVFVTDETEAARYAALGGNPQALVAYETWFNTIVENLPGVYHYSWIDFERKMKLYRDYWDRHWDNLSSADESDQAKNNMFFDVPWSEVTDEMIKQRAVELSTTGGHIFHAKWDGKITPSIKVKRKQPKSMENIH